MRKTTLIACIAVSTALSTSTFAVTPASRDVGSLNFKWTAEDFSRWHLALYAGQSTRQIKPSGLDTEVEVGRYTMILGYDLSRWLTVYGLAGLSRAKPDGFMATSDNSGVFGAGVWANLIEVDQLSLLSTITQYRLASGAEVSHAGFDDFTWTQFDAFLTLELVNELPRASFIHPEAISLFVGPILSYVESDNLSFTSDNILGMTIGVSILFTDDTYVTAGADVFADDHAVYGMVGVRF